MRMKKFMFDNNAYDDCGELEGSVHVETYTRPELGTDKYKELIVFAFYPDPPKDVDVKMPEEDLGPNYEFMLGVCKCTRKPFQVIKVADARKPVCPDCNKPIRYGLIAQNEISGPAETRWGQKMIVKVDEQRKRIDKLISEAKDECTHQPDCRCKQHVFQLGRNAAATEVRQLVTDAAADEDRIKELERQLFELRGEHSTALWDARNLRKKLRENGIDA